MEVEGPNHWTVWEFPELALLRGIFKNAATAAAKSLQSCPTLCDPIDGSPPGSPIPGILQARTLEWVAFSFSNAGKWKVKVKSLSHVWLFATPWTVDHQAPLSVGFPRQEYCSGLPLPSPGHLPYPGIKPRSSELQADSLLSEPPGKPTHYTFVVKCLKPFIFQVEKLRSEEERFA